MASLFLNAYLGGLEMKVPKLFSRIYDLVLKIISYKVFSAGIVTLVYIVTPGLGTVGFIIVAMTWALTVGFRYAEKLKGLLPVGKEE
jgi:hypothetical protein